MKKNHKGEKIMKDDLYTKEQKRIIRRNKFFKAYTNVCTWIGSIVIGLAVGGLVAIIIFRLNGMI